MNNKTEDLFEGMLIEEDNFFIQVEAESDQQIIRLIGNHFFKKGFVKESYTQAVLDREEIYPTGLEAPGGGIAIPHTDAHHVHTSTIGVATLKSPVEFRVMAEPDKVVSVSVVMMLAVSDPQKVIPVLTKVISIVEDEDAVKELIASTSKEHAKELVVNHIRSRYNVE
jgi:PTS system galactitol-specific IIA component